MVIVRAKMRYFKEKFVNLRTNFCPIRVRIARKRAANIRK